MVPSRSPRGTEAGSTSGRAAGAAPPGPSEALRRIAYLLEASRAETFKVRAFRRAAASIDDAGPERVAALGTSGRLAELPGLGPTTAAVVVSSLTGEVHPYLADLEARRETASTPDVAAFCARLQGDLHSHSDWSDGGSPIEEMALAAVALGHRYLALTDHSPRLTVAHGLDADRLRRQLDVVDELNERLTPFRVLTGIEVDILLDGALDQEPELLSRLDVVVASVHSKLRMESKEMTPRMVAAVENPHTDILGHCTGRIVVGRGRPPSSFDPDAVFEACARTGTAVEINSRPERQDPPPDLLHLAVAAGCVVSIDTDAHAPGQLEWQRVGAGLAVDAGIDPERVVNTWPLDRLLGWTASHEGTRPPAGTPGLPARRRQRYS
ncbi:MAG TPA: PHP domain-containing protein [Acidimicrobiales bacterium]|nr:PHP domain-containing protein [Acidimicrobiales bacterium]